MDLFPVTLPIREPGAEDPETGEKPLLIVGFRPGFHLNGPRSAMDARPDLDPYRREPETPERILAGDEKDTEGRWVLTGFLSFADEAEAVAVLGPDFMSEEHGEDE